MKNLSVIFWGVLLFVCMSCRDTQSIVRNSSIKNDLRAPAYPLIMIDPYTNAWMFGDTLYQDEVRHWTGEPCPLTGALRVDGTTYRFMGTSRIYPDNKKSVLTRAAIQKSVDVQATQTYYEFECGPVSLKLIFTSPLLLDSLELLSRPVNYITYEVSSLDKTPRQVEIYFEASPFWATDSVTQPVTVERVEEDGIVCLKTGTKSQKILKKSGDNVRIDWGYFYLAVQEEDNVSVCIAPAENLRTTFYNEGRIEEKDINSPDNRSGVCINLGEVSTSSSGKVMIGYDDINSIQYFGTNLRPYWNRYSDKNILDMISGAEKDYEMIMSRCYQFDNELMSTARSVGGKEYAELCALAYRQAIAAHKLVESPDGELMFLSKENFSNGSIGTVDITYPSSPLFLLYNVELVKALLNPIFHYSESGRWSKPFPAHDIGTYPLANGQTYNGDMPVEESGNMLILTSAVCSLEGKADYALQHWETLTKWVQYLEEKGLDPEEQLCTDDFAGHFAHNTNLSIKAILGIASYSRLARQLGEESLSDRYRKVALEMSDKWIRMSEDGDHYRLTFDKQGTWSQKYNLIWNKIMNMGIFPDSIIDRELRYYRTQQNRYGLPLDNRATYTKTDWIIWTASLSSDTTTFREFVKPLYRFMNETEDRIPMSDWIFTDKPHHKGFRARSVVGGYFIKMLDGKLNRHP